MAPPLVCLAEVVDIPSVGVCRLAAVAGRGAGDDHLCGPGRRRGAWVLAFHCGAIFLGALVQELLGTGAVIHKSALGTASIIAPSCPLCSCCLGDDANLRSLWQ